MSRRKPLKRIAFVRFAPNGSSYPTACPRSDLGVGDEVEVWMRAGQPDEHYLQGIITAVRRERWQCSCRTVNLASEVAYAWVRDPETGKMTRQRQVVRQPVAIGHDACGYEDDDGDEYDLRDVYAACQHEDGADAYLGDGLYLTAGGRLYEH